MRKYKIIYADPPWDYGGNFPSSSDKHAYPLMRTEDICALPVEHIAHPDSILFLWATMSKLPEAFRVIEAWGFHYVSNCSRDTRRRAGISGATSSPTISISLASTASK